MIYRILALALLIYTVAPVHAFTVSKGSMVSSLRASRSAQTDLAARPNINLFPKSRTSAFVLRMAGGENADPAEGKFAQMLADCKDWGLCRFIVSLRMHDTFFCMFSAYPTISVACPT